MSSERHASFSTRWGGFLLSRLGSVLEQAGPLAVLPGGGIADLPESADWLAVDAGPVFPVS